MIIFFVIKSCYPIKLYFLFFLFYSLAVSTMIRYWIRGSIFYMKDSPIIVLVQLILQQFMSKNLKYDLITCIHTNIFFDITINKYYMCTHISISINYFSFSCEWRQNVTILYYQIFVHISFVIIFDIIKSLIRVGYFS